MPNGIDLILHDHRHVEELFATFRDTHDASVVGQIIDALTAHDEAEHAALYPLATEVLDDAALIVSMDTAHSAIKKQIDHLRTQEGGVLVDEVEGLEMLVTEHIADEEKQLLPQVSERATKAQLDWLGTHLLDTKQRVG